jgi:hypothetical protein
MFTVRQSLVTAGLGLMLLAANTAMADTVTIRVYNDGSDDIVATVYDLNAQPPGIAIANQRISGFAWIPVLVTAGASGFAHVRWTATVADTSFRRCGHQDRRGLTNDSSVRVFAESGCTQGAR